MGPIQLFDLAARQARWLSSDQAVIASNVSNANTPDYRARTLQPFTAVLDQTALELASTRTGHLSMTPADQQRAAVREDSPWETSESGNSVSLEQEMMKASDVNRAFSLNSSIVKAFHGMLMASVKG